MEGILAEESLVLITSGLIVRAFPIINAYSIERLGSGFFLGAFVCSALLHDLALFLGVLRIFVNYHHIAESVVYDGTVVVGKRQGLSVNIQRLIGDFFLLGVIALFLIVFDYGRAKAEPGGRVARIGFGRVLEKILGFFDITLIVFNHALIELVLGDNFSGVLATR